MIVIALLPLVALLSIWYCGYSFRAILGLDRVSRRGALVIAFIVSQALVAVVSEATSAVGHFTFNGVLAAWLVVDVVVVFLAVRRFRRGPGVPVRLRGLAVGLRQMSIWERVLAVLGVALLGLWITIGWLYDVPTNGDSLVYHLTRVAHWGQNGSVHHYPAHYSAVNEFSPLHEYNMAHLHLLFGSDRLDAFVQLLAVVICVVGASELARLLGASRRGQILAAAFTATIPSLILEVTSTQNNDFAAAVTVGLLVLLFSWRLTGRYLVAAALIGSAIGAAVLTKGTLGIVVATSGLVLIGLAVARSRLGVAKSVQRVALSGGVALVLAIVVAGPFFARNVEVYGGMTGPSSATTLSTNLTANAAAANVIRSVASNFQIGDGTGVATWISQAVLTPLHQAYLSLGVDPADTNYVVGVHNDAFSRADYTIFERNDAIGANPWHTTLIVITLIALVVFVLRGDRKMRVPLLFAATLVLSFLLFTALARWSPFTARYQVPLFVAWCPLIALVVERARKAVGSALMVVLLVLAWPQLLDTDGRSILHPAWDKGTGIETYFRTWNQTPDVKAIAAGEQAAADVVANTSCPSVGLANWVFFEYPLWIALRDNGYHGRIDNVSVQDPSKVLADPALRPCALIRQVEPNFSTFDTELASLQFGPIAVSVPPALVNDKTPDQPGFHSDVPGVRVLPGSNWTLGGERPAIKDTARIHVLSDTPRAVRVRVTGSTTPIAGWTRLSGGEWETIVRLDPGPNTLDLPGQPGQVSSVGGVTIVSE